MYMFCIDITSLLTFFKCIYLFMYKICIDMIVLNCSKIHFQGDKIPISLTAVIRSFRTCLREPVFRTPA